MKTIKSLIIFLTIGFTSCKTGTQLRNIPIVSDDAYTIQIWGYNEEINAWGWYDIRQAELESQYGWYSTGQINMDIDRFEEANFYFIRGFDDCRDTTKLTVYGSYLFEKIKDKKDLRKEFFVNGEHQTFGTKIEKPE